MSTVEEGAKRTSRLSDARPSPADLPAFLPYACRQLQTSFHIKVLTETLGEYFSKTDEKGKRYAKTKSPLHPNSPMHGVSKTATVSQEKVEGSGSISSVPVEYKDVVIRLFTNPSGRVAEILFYRCRQIPRLLIKLLGMCMPYQQCLTKLSFRWSRLDGLAIYELAKLLPESCLTEICLDDSPVSHRNYAALLEHGQLRVLSLARCDLHDEECCELAAKLTHPLPASKSLVALSLVSNRVGDVGAAALATALRSNRTLQHLDLAGNAITDVGAADIFKVLQRFHLTCYEITMKRKRLMTHTRRKNEVYLKCLHELTTTTTHKSVEEQRFGKHKTISRPRKSNSILADCVSPIDTALRAAMMTNEVVGAYSDPFSSDETVSESGSVFALGNLALCSLNLAYNELGYASAVRLLAVLEYQRTLATRSSGPGLMRVMLEGNALPVFCIEMLAIQDMLEKSLTGKSTKQLRRTERNKSKSVR